MVIGCSDRVAVELEAIPEGDPVVLEPGDVSLPPPEKGSPPFSAPSCHRRAAEVSSGPAIEILSAGGFSGGGFGNVRIWEDGTVLFDGGGCPNGGRRGKMSAARIAALLDKLENAGFFDWPCKERGACVDMFVTSLTVHRGRNDNTVVDTGCNRGGTDVTGAIALVMNTVGKNACSPECRATPAPASCR
jgi:hypothetical protein